MIRKLFLGSAVAVGVLVIALCAMSQSSGTAQAAVPYGSYCHANVVGSSDSYTHLRLHGDWAVRSDADAAACTDVTLVKPALFHVDGAGRNAPNLIVCRAGNVVVIPGVFNGGGYSYPGFLAGDIVIFTLAKLAAC